MAGVAVLAVVVIAGVVPVPGRAGRVRVGAFMGNLQVAV